MGTDLAGLPQVRRHDQGAEPVDFGKDADGHSVLTAAAFIPQLNWYVFFEQPLNQALQPVYRLLYRTGWLLAGGILLAVLAGCCWRAIWSPRSRRCRPARGNWRASDFGHRIDVHTGDEIEELADQFNRMADELQGSYGRLEQKVEERTSDLAQSIKELKALEEIGRAVASSLDPEAVLAAIVTRRSNSLSADAGEIFSYDAASGTFSSLPKRMDLIRSFQQNVRAARITLDDSVLGLSARQGKAVSLPDLSSARGRPAQEADACGRVQFRPCHSAARTG